MTSRPTSRPPAALGRSTLADSGHQHGHDHGHHDHHHHHGLDSSAVGATTSLSATLPPAGGEQLLPLPADHGIMILGHGSRSTSATSEFGRMAGQLAARFHPVPTRYGFLEFATPIIRDGLDELRALGMKRILAVPALLFAAGHAKNDMPSVINRYQQQHPDLVVSYGRELAIDPRLLAAAGDSMAAVLPSFSDQSARKSYLADTLLLVVGRGTSDPDANSNINKVMRFLWEGMGFGWGEVAYSGVTFPLVAPALQKIARLGYRRVVVFPYFLFSGILVDRIYAAVDEAAAFFTDITFIKAPYLNDNPRVLDTMVARVNEIIVGQGLMNCQLCKYRQQVLGFEAEVGLRQESHHEHVEGIGQSTAAEINHGHGTGGDHHHGHEHGDKHSHQHDDGHDHNHEHGQHGHEHGNGHEHGQHGHHHHPYPFADHPLGPRTLAKIDPLHSGGGVAANRPIKK